MTYIGKLGRAAILAGLGLAVIGCSNAMEKVEKCGDYLTKITFRNGKIEYEYSNPSYLRERCTFRKYGQTDFLQKFTRGRETVVFLNPVGNEEDAKLSMEAYRRMKSEGNKKPEVRAVSICDLLVKLFDTCPVEKKLDWKGF